MRMKSDVRDGWVGGGGWGGGWGVGGLGTEGRASKALGLLNA